jgi:ABC-2 type transport system ATP-binding protein
MTNFQVQFEETRKLLDFDDFPLLTKRLIDFTLDTNDLGFYRKMVALLDWFEENGDRTEEKKQKATDLLDELYPFLNEKAVPQADSPLLTTHNLIKSYKKSAFALGPVSLSLHRGEIVGLVGENGNGKTTLLRTLCGELQPTGGSIQYLFPHSDDYNLRSQLIYIPQRTPSWHGSLLSNLRFTAASYGILDQENLLTVELTIARMGLRKFRTYKWKDLSSGYKMRFELARALLRKPQLLLIDEPLANLDILAQQIVLDDFRDIACSPFRPLGIVLSSQQLYEVEKTSDSVVFLKEGRSLNPEKDLSVNYVEVPKLIIEFESSAPQETLRKAFQTLHLEKLQINGGTYVACFPNSVSQADFLQFILKQSIPISYFRNISQSTRRFFLS